MNAMVRLLPCVLRALRVSAMGQLPPAPPPCFPLISSPMRPLRILLEHSIDYAGLFPPAGLAMGPAVENYAAYRAGPHAWALGRFVLPASRLEELETAAAGLLTEQPTTVPWRLSVLLGADPAAEVRALGELNCRHAASGAAALVADVVELKAATAEQVESALAALPKHLQVYVEIPVDQDPAHLVAAITRRGARAKVRAGGITPEAFPSTADLLRFLRACTSAGVPFKATAGLHHPLRASYRLTYEADSPRGTMFGFLNLFLTAAFLHQEMDDADAARLLEEGDPRAFTVDDSDITWRGRRIEADALRAAREQAIVSFGSCSFTEPIDDLVSLHLL